MRWYNDKYTEDVKAYITENTSVYTSEDGCNYICNDCVLNRGKVSHWKCLKCKHNAFEIYGDDYEFYPGGVYGKVYCGYNKGYSEEEFRKIFLV